MPTLTIRYGGFRALTLLAVICLGCATVAAGDANDVPEETKVSTELERLMLKSISVQFRETPIDDVIRIMADQAGVDIVKSPNVQGPVTLTLTDVPLEEALNSILSAHGFTYTLSDNIIRVMTAEEKMAKPEPLKTETYEILYADVTAVVQALEKFKSSQGSGFNFGHKARLIYL